MMLDKRTQYNYNNKTINIINIMNINKEITEFIGVNDGVNDYNIDKDNNDNKKYDKSKGEIQIEDDDVYRCEWGSMYSYPWQRISQSNYPRVSIHSLLCSCFARFSFHSRLSFAY